MSIQTLVPQYYDYKNSYGSGVVVTSSGTFDNYHYYVNDSTDSTYLVGAGGRHTIAFGMGDILLRPKRIDVAITISGSQPSFYLNRQALHEDSILFINRHDSSIIGVNENQLTFPCSGRFDTHRFQLNIASSSFYLPDLENSILKLNINPSSEFTPFETRLSRIELTVSGDPLYSNDCYLFIPGNVRNRLHETGPGSASNTSQLIRGNFQSLNFNLGHYLFDEGSGSVVYSSGTPGSGILHFDTPHWYNYYRNPLTSDVFRQGLDVVHNGTGVGNYLDFGSNVATGDFTLYMRYSPTGAYPSNEVRNLFSAGDFNVDFSDGGSASYHRLYLTLARTTLTVTNVELNDNWKSFAAVYRNQNLKCFNEHGNLIGSVYVPNRINPSGHIFVGAKSDPFYESGNVPYEFGNPFAVAEVGIANYGFTDSNITDFYNSLGNNTSEYIREMNVHPSADTTYVYNRLMDASGEYTSQITIYPSSFPDQIINLTSPAIMNDDIIAPSSFTLRLGITSNTTNPSGIILGGRYQYGPVNPDYPTDKISNFFEHRLPSGYFQGFVTLSGYLNAQSQSGFYHNDAYNYIHSRDVGNLTVTITNPYSPRYSSETKIHSATFVYDAWFIPETGILTTPLYISGAPIRTNDIDLFIEGEENQDSIDLFVRGLSTYSGNTTLFIMGGIEQKSCPLYTKGMIEQSGNTTLFIAGQTERDTIPLYMHNESFPNSGQAALFIFGTSPGTSGNFNSINLYVGGGMSTTMPLYLHNEDSVETNDTMPLVLFGNLDGGTNSIPMYICNSGAESENDTTLFLMGSPFIDAEGSMPLYINRATSNDSHFTTLFIQNNGSELSSILFTQGAYISDSGLTLFMPSSFTPTENSVRLYSHGY